MKRSERQGRKGKIYPNAQLQRLARRDKEAFLNEQCKKKKKKRKTKEWEILEISSRKMDISREQFMQGWHNQGQKMVRN